MKKKNFFAIFTQAGLALAAALLIGIGLASCSKNKADEDVIYMTTNRAIEEQITLNFEKNDGPITVAGAEVLESSELGGMVAIKYKVKTQDIAVKGFVTQFDCSNCDLTYLNVRGKKELKELYCNFNPALSKLEINNVHLIYLGCLGCVCLTKLEAGKNKRLEYLDCSGCKELSELNLRNNSELKQLHCRGTKITGDALKLPQVKGNENGSLFFKYGSDTEQKLSPTQVTKIKDKLNWNVLYSPTNDGNWVEYPGED